jgi:hypothetical protein
VPSLDKRHDIAALEYRIKLNGAAMSTVLHEKGGRKNLENRTPEFHTILSIFLPS